MDNDRPIFIVGCPRSGTTLLSVLLHAHPNIAMPPETRFLLPAYYEREKFGDLRVAGNRRRLAEQITGKGSGFRDLRLDRAATIDAVVAAPPTMGSALATVWREFATSRGKPRWGEKRPAYWREMGVIMRLFPSAQIIHLVRDPRSCVASLTRVPWWNRTVPDSTAVWGMSNRTLNHLGRRLSADSYHRLRYEDLVSDVRGTLERTCAFLGEDFADSMLEHATAAADIVPKRKTWHGLVGKEVDAKRTQGWRGVLDPRQVGLVEAVSLPQMLRYGYQRSDIAARPKMADVAESLNKIAHTRAWMAKRRLEDARLRRRLDQPLASQL